MDSSSSTTRLSLRVSSTNGPDATPRASESEVVGEIGLLFELSLAIGTSLDLRENCQAFFEALMAGKRLDYAAVWLREDLTRPSGQGDVRTYALAYAMPEAREAEARVPATHPLVAAVRERGVLRYTASAEPAFGTEGVALKGATVAIALGQIGLLKLHSSRDPDAFSQARLSQMRSVIDKFARSLEGCLAHQQLIHEVAERQRAEEEARTIAERLRTVLATVGDGITLSDDTGQFAVYNERMEEITGYTHDEANTADLLGRLHPSEAMRNRALEQLKRVEQEGRVSDVETEIVAKDGTLHTLLVSTSLLVYKGRAMYLSAFRDITERKRADQEVRDLKQFYEQVLAAMPIQLAVFDPEGRYLYLNPAAIPDPERRKATIGQSVLEYARDRGMDTEVQERRVANVRRVIETGERVSFEEAIVRPSGTTRHYTRAVAPIFGDDGALKQLIAYGADVTDQRNAEHEIQRLKQFYEEILNSLPVDLAVFDREARYVYVNPNAIRDPQRRAWIIGKTNAEYARERGFSVELGAQRDANVLAVLATGELQDSEEHLTDRDGNVRYYVRRLSPIHDETGAIYQAIGYGIEVTERTRIENALRASEARYKQFVEAASDIIYRLDSEGRFTYANPVALRVIGLDADKATGLHFETLVAPECLEDVRAFYEKQFAERLTNTYYEMPIITTRGETVWIGQNVQLVFEGERMVGLQAVARDITERKRTEAALLEAKQIAEDSSRAKEQFLANMSHEIRTPMNAVLGMTHLLMGTGTTDEQGRYLNAIKFSADNLLALINDLLDFSKIEAGKIVFEEVAFSVGDMLQGLADSLRFNAEERGLYLLVETSPSVPQYLVGDPVRLNQILINLVGNALKFTESGGVRVLADLAENDGDAAHVRFRVEDTGIGIPKDKQALIFQSFSQASSDTTRKYGGTGLGLAIVKELVELQEGELDLESTEGVGTTFTVTLRYPVALSPPQLPALRGEPASLKGARILLVEDNEVNQFVAYRMLEQWGALVSIAENGRIAVERVAESADDPSSGFDLVLMDIQMPEMDGYEATRHIRSTLGRSAEDLPVLALTASTMADQRRAMLAAGMNEVVMKPFEPDMLRARIGSFLPERFHARIAGGADRSYGPSDPAPALRVGGASDPRPGDRTSLHASGRSGASQSSSARRGGPPMPVILPAAPSRGSSSEPLPAPPQPPHHPEPALDLSRLRANALGDANFVSEMMALAEEQMDGIDEHLTDALARGDAEETAFAAHKLKSTAGILGAMSLHAALEALETLSRRTPLPEPLPTLAAPALRELARTRAALAAAMER